MTKRSKSSTQWLQRQNNDDYVKRAIAEGYRSRAAYKLQELNLKDKILHYGMTVVDLGAAPGGWSQVAVEEVGKGRVIAIDLLPIDPIDGVDILIGDFTETEIYELLRNKLGNDKIDLVISDMAPNFSGIRDIDLPRAVYLAEIALDFAVEVLKPGGGFLVKLFQGEGFTEYVHMLKQTFVSVVIRKPKASRKESREIYAYAKTLKKSIN